MKRRFFPTDPPWDDEDDKEDEDIMFRRPRNPKYQYTDLEKRILGDPDYGFSRLVGKVTKVKLPRRGSVNVAIITDSPKFLSFFTPRKLVGFVPSDPSRGHFRALRVGTPIEFKIGEGSYAQWRILGSSGGWEQEYIERYAKTRKAYDEYYESTGMNPMTSNPWKYHKYLQHKYPKERITPEERRQRYAMLRASGLSPREAARVRDWHRPSGVYVGGVELGSALGSDWPVGIPRPSARAAVSNPWWFPPFTKSAREMKAYHELNNLYLSIQRGARPMTRRNHDRLMRLLTTAYEPMVEQPMIEWWMSEFRKLPGWQRVNPVVETLVTALATGVGFGGGYAAIDWGIKKAKNRKKR